MAVLDQYQAGNDAWLAFLLNGVLGRYAHMRWFCHTTILTARLCRCEAILLLSLQGLAQGHAMELAPD